MFISKLKIRNWKNFTKAEVDLSETVYILGPNASGKSNLLDVFRFIRDIAKPYGGGLQTAIKNRGGFTKIRSLAARRPPRIEIEIELRSKPDNNGNLEPDWKYILWINSETRGLHRPLVAKEEVYKRGVKKLCRPDDSDRNDSEKLTQTHLEQIGSNQEFREIAEFFDRVMYLHLVPQLLKFGEQFSIINNEADPFGQSFLEMVAKTTENIRKSRLRKIEEVLLKVVPNLKKLEFERDKDNGKPHLRMLYDHWRPNAGWQREDQFSDGTLRMIGMHWALLGGDNLILLEEPELSLHKAIVEQIPKLIVQTRKSRKSPGGQIIISTHSEVMLSSKSIDGSFLILKPGTGGESKSIELPTKDDLDAMRAGLSPSDVLLPKTSESIKSIG